MVHDKCTEMVITNTNTTINIRIAYIIGNHDQDTDITNALHTLHTVTIGKHFEYQ